jgi:hypothetical protein
MRLLVAVPTALTPIAFVAAVLGLLLLPSTGLAERSDLCLPCSSW